MRALYTLFKRNKSFLIAKTQLARSPIIIA